jgi:hypothetical protein
MSMSITRKILLLLAILVLLAAVPPPSQAASRSMSDEEIAALTCGHLGVPCARSRGAVRGARARHAPCRAPGRRAKARGNARCRA